MCGPRPALWLAADTGEDRTSANPPCPKPPPPKPCQKGPLTQKYKFSVTNKLGNWGANRDVVQKKLAAVYAKYKIPASSTIRLAGPNGQKRRAGGKATTWYFEGALSIGEKNLCKPLATTIHNELANALKAAVAQLNK